VNISTKYFVEGILADFYSFLFSIHAGQDGTKTEANEAIVCSFGTKKDQKRGLESSQHKCEAIAVFAQVANDIPCNFGTRHIVEFFTQYEIPVRCLDIVPYAEGMWEPSGLISALGRVFLASKHIFFTCAPL
jgi:hypothetical protein